MGYVFFLERRKREREVRSKWTEMGFVVGVCVDQRGPKRIKSVVSGRLESVRSTGYTGVLRYILMTCLTGKIQGIRRF